MQLNKTEKQLILVDLILFSFDKDYKVVTLHFFCATWSRCGALPRLVLSGLQRVARPPPLTKPNTRVRARNAARDTHQAVPINPAESTRTGKKTLGKNIRRLRKEWQESPPPTVRVFHSFSRLNKHSASVIWRMCLVSWSVSNDSSFHLERGAHGSEPGQYRNQVYFQHVIQRVNGVIMYLSLFDFWDFINQPRNSRGWTEWRGACSARACCRFRAVYYYFNAQIWMKIAHKMN